MRKGGIIAIIIIAVLVIAAVVGFIVYNNSNSSGSSTGGTLTTTSGGASGQGLSFEQNEEQKLNVERGIAMPGWEYMEIAANTKDVEVDLYNPDANEGYYHLAFELILDDTGETLYKSGLVKAGDHVRNITLSKALTPGTYNATLKINTYTADDALTQKNGGSVSFKLKVVEV